MIKLDSERKKKLKKVAKLMNKQTKRPIPTFIGALLKLLDSFLTVEETDFIIGMGEESLSRSALKGKLELPKEKFAEVFNGLIQKGIIWSETSETGEERYKIAPMMIGWFEMQASDGNLTPDDKSFLKQIFRANRCLACLM